MWLWLPSFVCGMLGGCQGRGGMQGTHYNGDDDNCHCCGHSLLVTTMVATLSPQHGPCIWYFFLKWGRAVIT